ncbi:MAG: DUF4845 domain-containing protein [Pseudomonadota bacterium]
MSIEKSSVALRRQSGMTTIGLIFLIVFLSLFVYAALRLVPVYLEDQKVSGAFASIEEEFTGTDFSRRDLVGGLQRRFEVESVNAVSWKDVEFVKTGSGYDVKVRYTNTVRYVANISFAVDFSHSISVVR